VIELGAKIELRDQKHLWITYNPPKADIREIIIDEEKGDVRISDGHVVIKVQFKDCKLNSILVNDNVVWGYLPERAH
jgi:hypothetical protein